MIFEALNDNVMIVELSGDEMKKYSVTYDTLSLNDCRSRDIVRKISDCANALRSEKSKNITVEALPGGDGGCFFIFTFDKKSKRRYRVKSAPEKIFLESDSTDFLLDFVSAARKCDAGCGKCEIYRFKNKYILSTVRSGEKLVRIMEEFGTVRRAGDLSVSRLMEYGAFMGKF